MDGHGPTIKRFLGPEDGIPGDSGIFPYFTAFSEADADIKAALVSHEYRGLQEEYRGNICDVLGIDVGSLPRFSDALMYVPDADVVSEITAIISAGWEGQPFPVLSDTHDIYHNRIKGRWNAVAYCMVKLREIEKLKGNNPFADDVKGCEGIIRKRLGNDTLKLNLLETILGGALNWSVSIQNDLNWIRGMAGRMCDIERYKTEKYEEQRALVSVELGDLARSRVAQMQEIRLSQLAAMSRCGRGRFRIDLLSQRENRSNAVRVVGRLLYEFLPCEQ
jgi:hypothetical protein